MWERAGHDFAVARPSDPEEVRAVARQAVEAGHDAVLAFSGDGMLSDLVPALLGSRSALAPVPCGTGNDFAAHLGLPRRPLPALRALLQSRPLAADVLEVTEAADAPTSSSPGPARRYCLNIAGTGFDARVAAWLNETRGHRRLSGKAAYIWGVAATLRRLTPQRTRLVWDGDQTEELETMMVAVCNARQYGGGMKIAPMADITDGLLDVCVVERLSRAAFVWAFPRVFWGRHLSHPSFRQRRARRVRIETEPPQPVLIDGDVVAQTPIEFVVRPGALRVLAPQDI